MTTVQIQTRTDLADAAALIEGAVGAEVARLELALQAAQRRLRPFEDKYGKTSHEFLEKMTVEDLTGGEEEYLSWAGEYRLALRLEEKLRRYREIRIARPA